MDKNSKGLTTLYELPLNHHNKESDPRTDPNLSKNYKIIDNSYICHKRFVIGSGSFGKVLYGTSIDKSKDYAIKFEKSSVKHSVIKDEMKILQDLSGGEGIPNIYYYGQIDEYKVLVMDLLGPSLDKFYKISDKKLTLETTVNFGIEMIHRIEYVHSKNYLHRDIKPNNFLLGKFDKNFNKVDNTVYIVDFGLSKPYVDPLTNKHYEYRDNSRFVGTPRYASLNTHLGIRQGRRDDLEAIVYVLIYFLKSELPWQGIKAKTKSEKKEKIKNKKKRISINKLCEGLPMEFFHIVDYVKNLQFEDKPNYDYIRRMLSRVKSDFNLNFNIHFPSYMWEWENNFLESVMYYNDENFSQFNKIKKLYDKLYEGYPVCSYEEYLLNLKKRNDTLMIDQKNVDENLKNEKEDNINGSKHNITIVTNDSSNLNSFVMNSGNTPISSPCQSALNGTGKIKIYNELHSYYSRAKVKGINAENK